MTVTHRLGILTKPLLLVGKFGVSNPGMFDKSESFNVGVNSETSGDSDGMFNFGDDSLSSHLLTKVLLLEQANLRLMPSLLVREFLRQSQLKCFLLHWGIPETREKFRFNLMPITNATALL